MEGGCHLASERLLGCLPGCVHARGHGPDAGEFRQARFCKRSPLLSLEDTERLHVTPPSMLRRHSPTLGPCPRSPSKLARRLPAQTVTPQIIKKIEEFSPQNMSNTIWALATLKDYDLVRDMHRVGYPARGCLP